ncbi:HEAT repeat domain-containing protein [Candidatus Neptunochlamydia vexilliferae]|uniref:HEAT repeat domain-containing protein n=1 Tax=Candidatus Neptunichlamydia vexilliferae TaxID=1651774 RepID=A0ABS0AY21_9BACT|nr:HEAT repeat domain-containing protein [Candidatus Neptunochlamydia vexilliferae]MBF5059021.1 hypothetical protein [Candidatus Neptunochlamydia vexilliferae]
MRLILVLLLTYTLFASEEEVVRRVYSHLLIHDYRGAIAESEKGLVAHPDSQKVKKAYIRSLAENGKDDEAISSLGRFGFKKEEVGSDLIETLAWGILMRSENSPQFVVNMASLVSAYYTDDVRAVRMLLHQLSSSNALLRRAAAQLAAHYRDISLIEELVRLLSAEKNWFVRLEVIKALGAMEVKEIEEPLKKIIISSRTTLEEKGEAIASLVNIYEEVGEEEFSKLVTSRRAGLRHLACQIVSHLDLKEKASAICKLLDDPTSDVRIAALNTLYFLGLKNLSSSTLSKIIDFTEDSHPPVALTAAWVTSRFAPETALQVIRKWIYSTDESSRRLAAFILGRIGSAGIPLATQVFKITPDPFVKANLALGSIGQGGNHQKLSDTLYTFLLLRKGKLMWDHSENPLFELIAPSQICHIPQVPQYPTMVDQLTRLEILGMLAALRCSKAEEAIKAFLKEEPFGVTYAASNTLLEEGGEEAIEILRDLLQEKDQNIRVQAALVLALSGGESKAVQILHEAYPTVDRETKINILGALGYIGDKASIPFLMELLKEPHQVLKVVAASALIQCVYH